MGASFKRSTVTAFPTVNTDVTVYTCPASGVLSTVVHGIFIANVTTSSITATVKAAGATLLSGATIPAGGTQEFDKPVNLQPSDTLVVQTNTVNGCHVFASVMENS